MLPGILSGKKIVELKFFSSRQIPFVAFAFVAIGFFSCCKEVGPNINLFGDQGSDSSGYVDSSQQKNVLLEDFTASNCTNCPKGRDVIDNLLALYPGRMEVVEVHQGPLSFPLLPGNPAFKTQDGEDLAAYLGPPPFWPSGAVDRILYPDGRLIDRNLWPTYVPEELDSPLKVMLGVNTIYNNSSRVVTGSVTVDFLQTITDALNITVLITESGIVAAQLDGVIIDTFYVHRDVLRDIVTGVQGDLVTGAKTQGSAWTYTLNSYSVPVEWNADSCRIIACVSKSAGSYDVLQAMGKSLK
ncbi:MAG TPA: Omp28-related outer membrane protein [Chitinophagales bacterium]|nr:Omp28-related outer membrane protein [Chitinophagales bacterium]